MSTRNDYTSRAFPFAVLVIGMLLLLSALPPSRLGGGGKLRTKRVNILSDIWHDKRPAEIVDTLAYSDTTFLSESLLAASPESMIEAQSTPIGTSQSWEVSPTGFVAVPDVPAVDLDMAFDVAPTPTPAPPLEATPQRADEPQAQPAIPIEDFDPAGGMRSFYAALQNGNPRRPVRIAVLGDSFIEADILTADLREQLQGAYGGRGVGFVPFASPLSKYRATIRHTFEGWETYGVLNKKKAPVEVQDKFFVSGVACIPTEGAWTRIEGTTFRKHIRRSSVARILFANTQHSTIHVTINDSIQSHFIPESSELVQQINLHGDIASIEVRITDAAGFTGYGIVLDDQQGVSVDNYSVRSNSGMALFGTNSAVNTQIGRLLGYDLIVLQYGLNSMSAGVLNYAPYTRQLVSIIDYVRGCFPGVPVVVMSVGDRSTRSGGEYVTMPAARAMLAAQQEAARQGRAAFWNTFEAMGGEGSMVRFVGNKWAAKDYTHIGYPGGRFIATELVRSLRAGVRNVPSPSPSDFLVETPAAP